MKNELQWVEKDGVWAAKGCGGFDYTAHWRACYIRNLAAGLELAQEHDSDEKTNKAFCQSHHDAICKAVEEAEKISYGKGVDRGAQDAHASVSRMRRAGL